MRTFPIAPTPSLGSARMTTSAGALAALPQAQWPIGRALLALLDRVLPEAASGVARRPSGARAGASSDARVGAQAA
jgi:hypothetical protein